MSQPLTVAQFKTNFGREFPFGSRSDQVMDADVTRALNEGYVLYNDRLWISDTEKQIAFGYVSAHFLSLNFQAVGGTKTSGKGIKSTGRGPIQSKSVGSVSLTYQLPQSIVDSPILSGLLVTEFGRRYLQMLAPRMVGYMFSASEVGCMPTIDQSPSTVPEMLATGNFNIVGGFSPAFYFFYTMEVTEPAARLLVPRNGTLRGFRVNASANTLNASVELRFFKNGVAQTIVANLAAGSLSTLDNTNYVDVLAGDEITIRVDASSVISGQLTSLRASVLFA